MSRFVVVALVFFGTRVALADDPVVAPEAFELAGAPAAEEVWKVVVTVEQSAQGAQSRVELTESWRVVSDEGGRTIAMTLTGVAVHAEAPDGTAEDRAYGEADLARILDREGNPIPFARVWTVRVDGSWRPEPGVAGLAETIRQLVDYAGHRLEHDGALPSWVDRVPSELRMAAREFAAEVTTGVAVELHDAVGKGLSEPFATVLDWMHGKMPKMDPGAEIPIGVAGNSARFAGTTDEGRRGVFEFVFPGTQAQGVGQTARFTIDREGRPRSISLEQRVTMVGIPGGDVRQAMSFEVVEVSRP